MQLRIDITYSCRERDYTSIAGLVQCESGKSYVTEFGLICQAYKDGIL